MAQTKLEYSAFEKAKSEFETSKTDLQNALANLTNLTSEFMSTWEGATADTLKNKLDALANTTNSALTKLSSYQTTIDEIQKEYKKTEENSSSNVGGTLSEDDTWATKTSN